MVRTFLPRADLGDVLPLMLGRFLGLVQTERMSEEHPRAFEKQVVISDHCYVARCPATQLLQCTVPMIPRRSSQNFAERVAITVILAQNACECGVLVDAPATFV